MIPATTQILSAMWLTGKEMSVPELISITGLRKWQVHSTLLYLRRKCFVRKRQIKMRKVKGIPAATYRITEHVNTRAYIERRVNAAGKR